MAGKKAEKVVRYPAIEICHSHLYLAIATKHEDGLITVQTYSSDWRKQADSLSTDEGVAELKAEIASLVQEHKLHGMHIRVALNGDFCVTRVLTGTNEKVKDEFDQLEERSNLYLSLGHGKKAVGGSVRAIDARNQHALLTVVNQSTLDALVTIAKECGVRFDHVEPSLISVARLMGHTGTDADGPKLIVNLGERGVEVGISQAGQLLLDYRPPGREISERVATVIAGHLGRLQRYCDRYVGFSKGKLTSAVICGGSDAVAAVGGGFAKQTALPLEILDIDLSKLPWSMEGVKVESTLNGVLGCLLYAFVESSSQKTPNLMERLNALLREPLIPALLRTAWPVAAALAGMIVLGSVNIYQGVRVSGLETQVEEAKGQREGIESLMKKIDASQKKLVFLRNIKSRLTNPDWAEVTGMIGQCLPADAWLESVIIERGGHMVLIGASYSEDGVYEFEKWLNQLPVVQHVSIVGTENTSTNSGPAVTFNLKCEVVVNAGDDAKKDKRNDNA